MKQREEVLSGLFTSFKKNPTSLIKALEIWLLKKDQNIFQEFFNKIFLPKNKIYLKEM